MYTHLGHCTNVRFPGQLIAIAHKFQQPLGMHTAKQKLPFSTTFCPLGARSSLQKCFSCSLFRAGRKNNVNFSFLYSQLLYFLFTPRIFLSQQFQHKRVATYRISPRPSFSSPCFFFFSQLFTKEYIKILQLRSLLSLSLSMYDVVCLLSSLHALVGAIKI